MPTLIQSATGTSGTNSISATFASTPTSGDLLLAAHTNSDEFGATPSGWTLAASRGDASGVSLFYKLAGASEPTTVTITTVAANWGAALVLAEFDAPQATPLDKTITAGSGGSAVTSQVTGTTATTAQASELLIAAIFPSAGGSAVTPAFSGTWTNSFTQITTASHQAAGVALAYQVVSATGAYSSGTTWTGAIIAQGIMATFKYAAGGAAAGPFPPWPQTQRVIVRG